MLLRRDRARVSFAEEGTARVDDDEAECAASSCPVPAARSFSPPRCAVLTLARSSPGWAESHTEDEEAAALPCGGGESSGGSTSGGTCSRFARVPRCSPLTQWRL